MPPLIAGIVLLGLPSLAHAQAPAAAEDDDDFKFVVSLPTTDDRQAWQSPGFRMEIGYGRGGLWGAQAAPDADTYAALIRPGVRLEGPWSLYTSLAYAVALGGMSGVQYAVTVEPVFHLSDAVRLGVGVGFGGIIEGGAAARGEPDAVQRDALVGNQTLSSSDRPLQSCSGSGPVGVARLEWWVVMGPLSSVGLSFEGGWHRTGCEDDTGRVEPDTGDAIVRRQWWSHQSWRTSLLFGWR